MTREQTEKKAKEWCKQYIECNGDCRWCPNERYKDHFIEGAEFALSNQWVSVEDELPPDYRNVLIVTCSYGYYIAFYSNRHQCFVVENDVDIPNVTHWMPIPPLTKEGGEK